MPKVGNATGSPATASSTAVAEPEIKSGESSKTESNTTTSTPTPTTTPGANAAEKKADISMRGTQIASDLNKKVNPNAPSLEHIEKGGAVARQGQTGGCVSEVQRALNREGAKPPLEESGKFDAKTEAAVREYQKKNNLVQDGRVGPETLKKLVPSADTVSKNPQIAKLDPAMQKEISDRMQKSSNDPEVRARLMDVATAPGFDKLGAAQQREMLGILDKGPKDMGLADDLKKLAGSENFQKLDPAIQSHGLAQISNHSGDAVARDTLTKLQTTNGFQKLDKTEQERLLTLVGGKNEIISKPAREALADTMKDWKTDGNAEDQGKALKTFLKEQNWPDWQTPANGWDGRTTSPDSVKGPESVPTGPFRYKAGPADKYTVKYGSKEIPVFVPAGTPRADVDKLIGTMNALPAANRKMIDKMVLESVDRPDTEAFFDAGSRTVTAYPKGMALEPPSRRMSAMVHETAHLIDQHLGKKVGPQWDQDWKKAMQDDKLVASQYGKKSDAEDFAEVYLLYKLSEGKPEFDEY
ncbi:MAG TPA: peptidoglycan-binding protein, partial [Acidobacteriota bacterium]|nr:peptidoglycan-binding protein [Acidobacteriota bacterium]